MAVLAIGFGCAMPEPASPIIPSRPPAHLVATASMNGKYAELVVAFDVPADRAQYGDFHEYGYWQGGVYRGIATPEGYWVYVAPTWFVWARSQAAAPVYARPPPGPQPTPQPRPAPNQLAPAQLPAMPAPPATDWPEYDQLRAYYGELARYLQTRHDEILRVYRRNDGAEALAILTPIRDAMRDTEAKQQALLGCNDKRSRRDLGALWQSLGIRVERLGRPEHESVAAYVESRVMDGTITADEKRRVFRIISECSRGVMNPASLGADEIARAVVAGLVRFGLDTPGDGRRRSGAPARTTEPLLLAKKYASDHGIAFYSYRVNQIGNADGHFAPITILPDGGSIIVGHTSDIPPGGAYEQGKSHAVIVRLDPTGRLAWQRKLDQRGFRDYEGGGAARTADGDFIAFVLSYRNAAGHAIARFVKVAARGKVIWDSALPGKTPRSTPFPSRLVRLTERGTIDLAGHVYLDDGLHAWTGELGADGELIASNVGPLQGSHGGTSYGGATYGGAPSR
jgi:hypothetical protein